MPELPEVEVVRRGLQTHVVGKTITAVRVHHPRAVRRHEGGPADLTARLVEKEGQRALTEIADVRDRAALSAAIDRGVAEFGHLDIVVANAGICPLTAGLPPQAFVDAVDVDLVGVLGYYGLVSMTLNTFQVPLPEGEKLPFKE